MKRTSLILVAVFALVMLPAAFAQSTATQDSNQSPSATSPSSSQSPSSTQTPSTQDPTSQSPSSTQNPSTSQPPDTSSSSSPSSSTSSTSGDTQAHSFVGSIGKDSTGKYVLHAGTNDYQLDDQTQAQKFDGKTVKVTGRMDQSSNTIRVQ